MRELLNEPVIRKLLATDRLLELFAAARRLNGGNGGNSIANLLAMLEITCQVDAEKLARVPRCVPLLVVGNHPFGLLEGASLDR